MSQPTTSDERIDRGKLAEVVERERAAWIAARPRSLALHRRAEDSQLHGTPQHWVKLFPAPVPIAVDRAVGARIHDIDGHEYADFGLGGTAALWGHSHPVVAAALREQLDRGYITTWPNEDQVAVTENLKGRFGLPYWQFTVTATDANRFALLLARVATGRQRILMFNHAYHGSVDHTNAVRAADGSVVVTPGSNPNGVDVGRTTAVVEFNDLDALERELASGDIAAVITEPAMTCGGSIVLPEPGFHAGLRALTRRNGTLLIIDETQTIPAGPGGGTREFGVEPDVVTMGKCIAGGLPAGCYGLSADVAAAVADYTSAGDGGIGSTLAGGALPVRAMRAVLEEIMTESTYARMYELASAYEQGIRDVITQYRLPWHVVRLGARVAYAFVPEPVRNAGELSGHFDRALREGIWLYLANRGVVINGMSGSAQFAPLAEDKDVALHNELFADLVRELVAS